MLTIPHLALILTAYLAGSIPFSLLVARARGVDLRVAGSGNVGAANVWRTCGFGAFLLALSGDVLKGALPTFAAQMLNVPPLAVVTVGAAAMLGHARSVFLGFRGGKAVATGGGALLAMAPLVALAGLAVWGATFSIVRISSVASLAAAAACAVVAAVFFAQGALPMTYALFVWGAVVAILLLHRANIRRLRAGAENRF
ncbi:glycerol-3-phosphate 1-O-acyltransferase PlsY [Roseiflexus sp.]|uniref:glycerol-3-phosphate 1-O-acyltransferase PlsY n=1 Tax=Roseiflexus sp. TaxID=2562120 RepID=UPI0021DE4725|nr:glycerol-3-phosphate 1-O-acyltransferase PlsY [Roseiflexus sp.]GIW00009.1 MAG: glycerol-3-phosphate acyltransferase [Roseiflexus sp.]